MLMHLYYRAMRLTTEIALVSGLMISVVYYLAGGWLIDTFVRDADVKQIALAFLPYCAVVPLIGVPCWQLDGFFLGATRGKALRNAAVITTALYVATDLAFRQLFGNTGVWIAFLLMYVYRAFALGAYLPDLIKTSEKTPSVRGQR